MFKLLNRQLDVNEVQKADVDYSLMIGTIKWLILFHTAPGCCYDFNIFKISFYWSSFGIPLTDRLAKHRVGNSQTNMYCDRMLIRRGADIDVCRDDEDTRCHQGTVAALLSAPNFKTKIYKHKQSIVSNTFILTIKCITLLVAFAVSGCRISKANIHTNRDYYQTYYLYALNLMVSYYKNETISTQT
jgi:hypothetical protein